MTLTKISTGGVKDDTVSQDLIADEAVDEARLQISNAGTNGQFLSKQSGNTGGLTWATPPDTNTQLTLVDEDDMSSDSSTSVPSQQSVKAYVDAKAPTSITLTDESSDATCFPLFAIAATGAQNPKTGDNLTFNSVTGELEADIIKDSKGELRTIPQLSKSSKHTIVLADAGKHSINSSGGWELDTSTAFTAGMAITLINNSGSDQTIEADGVTLYNTADAATGDRTLAGRGMATVICTASNTYYISGAGLS